MPVVLDLRGTLGVNVDYAVNVAKRWLTGDLLDLKGRGYTHRSFTNKYGKVLSGPLRVLIDEKTGTLGKVVAAMLEAHGRATIIGDANSDPAIFPETVNLKGGHQQVIAASHAFVRYDGRQRFRIPAKDARTHPSARGKRDRILNFAVADVKKRVRESQR
jgi:hypothetical protein